MQIALYMHTLTREGGRVRKSTFPDHQVQAYESNGRPFDGFCVVRSGHTKGHRRIASASARLLSLRLLSLESRLLVYPALKFVY
jgi:hypothetical protein